MTRKIKELFFKYIRSNLVWCFFIIWAKIYNYSIRLLRIFSFNGFFFWPPIIRNEPTKKRCEIYNKKHKKKEAIYRKIYETNKVNKKLPKTIHKEISKALLEFINEPQYEQYVASIPNGRIAWRYTNITPDYKILRDSSRYLNKNTHWNPYTYKAFLWTPKRISWNIALVWWNDTHKNYNHWMTFAFPKFELFQKSWFKIDKFVCDESSRFNKECLEKIGIRPDQIIVLDEKSYIQADNLLVASTTTICWNVPQWAIDFNRKLFLTKKQESKKKKRLYISRVTMRKVSNEEEIFEYLKKFGFEKVILDAMSLTEQAELFNSAEIVVWPHWAWFTNIMFCEPWTKIIELFQPKTIRWHYYALSNACNLDYYYLVGDCIKNNSLIPMDRDMYIDINNFKETLKLAKIA